MADFGDFGSFSSGTNPTVDANANSFFIGDGDDPTADFLAREKAILGADAALFDDPTVGSAPAVQPTSPAAFGTDFTSPTSLGADSITPSKPAIASISPTADFNSFESNFGTTGDAMGFAGTSSLGASSLTGMPEAEPECIREWRERFEALIAERDSKSKEKHEATLKEAKEALERFYADYNDKKSKGIARNRQQEQEVIRDRDDTTSGNVWERAVKHIDTKPAAATSSASKLGKSPFVTAASSSKLGDADKKDEKAKKPVAKAKDTSRMKEVLLSLKKDNKAPGSALAVA
ncbi:hypothetical protein HK102_008023 [Quaeritorhiza haematococci]|nr:hypothetical protein HK102_008023 [Quaeritorhiza haematococci]